MRFSKLKLSRRAPFEVGFGMPWSVVFGLGMRDALDITTAVEVPRVSSPPQVDDAIPSGIPAPSRDDRDAWDRWWSDTIVNDGDPLVLMPRLTPWWSDVVTALTVPIGKWANVEADRFDDQMLAVFRNPEVKAPEQLVRDRVDAATGPRDSLTASVVIVPVTEPCWLEQGRVLVVGEATRESPDYEERLERFLHGLVQPGS